MNYNSKIKNKDLISICKRMSILLKSGTEITKILKILNSSQSNKNKKIISKININIQNGNSITKSFEETKTFTDFFINMIKVGEVTGTLDQIMEDLSQYYSKESQIKKKIVNSLTYPIIIIITLLASMLFMLIFVMPNFESLYEMNNVELVGITHNIMNLSKLVREEPLKLIVGVSTFILLVTIICTLKTKNISKIKAIIKIKTPYIGKVMLMILTTRMCRSLEILIKSGVNIIDAIDISAKVVDNILIKEKLETTKDSIQKGNDISIAMEKANIFPKTFITMIEIGEESGSLDYTLKITNDFYTEELNSSLEQMTKMIEPILTIIIGLIIGIFIIAMVIPMYDVINNF